MPNSEVVVCFGHYWSFIEVVLIVRCGPAGAALQSESEGINIKM